MRNEDCGRVPEDLDRMIESYVPAWGRMAAEDQSRLRDMAANLVERGMPAAFIGASLRSSAEVLRDLNEEESRPDNIFAREHVKRFIEENAVQDTGPRTYHPRRERKREERERLQANTQKLIREARLARGRHEVKKTRNSLLKVDQRELRRILGKEGDDLCRQINTWLRSTASQF
ncbi:MAG: hypothetical protein ACK47B_24310 [Armatimonadota bacterium]